MVLLLTYKGLINLMTGLFITSGILLVIAAVMNSNALMKSIGFGTWKDWWNEIKKH